MSVTTASLHILLLPLIVSTAAGVLKLTVTPDRGTTINISSSQVKGCPVCTGSGRTRSCTDSLVLKVNTPFSLEIECPRPQDVISVEIVRNIECTTKSCNGHIIQADSGSLPLLQFKRRFTWNLKPSSPKAFKIDFTKTGLRQISPSERCQDSHTYTLQALQTTGSVAVGRYCRTGPVSSAQILAQGRLSLDVPAGLKLQNGQFAVSVGEEIKSLAKISVTLPSGTSTSELLSPNYPDSFPDDDVMEWSFQVPDKHKAAVQLLNVTQPDCLKKNTAVEYHGQGRGALVLRLADDQPVQTQGSFSLTLRNCKMNRRRAGAPGLSLNIKVSASSSLVLCQVDLSKTEGLALHIDKLRPKSDCEMKMNSVRKENITVLSKGDLSFQGCLPEDVQVTATRVMECSQLSGYPKTAVPLLVPLLPPCLPAPLSSVTWTLRPAENDIVQLTSPTGLLKQDVPGQPCNDSILIEVAEEGGTTIGRFCPRGAIQKVNIKTNVSVTWRSRMGGVALRSYYKHVLDASFGKEIPETYIFTVSPKKDTPVLVATPGWPVGMKFYSTVSWIVSVPPKMEARLMFANISKLKCRKNHASIKVQRLGRLEEDYSRREDEWHESNITVSESFYLNMSNCAPESGDFRVITKITLHKAKNLLLTIILSVVAALLVIFIIVLVAVCVVVKKKKQQQQHNHQTSIYNPNGTNILPGFNGSPRSNEDNEDHVYHTIEDTLVYTHLLKKGEELGVYGEFDTHQSVAGHKDSQKPLLSKGTDANNMDVGVYQPFRAPPQQAPPLPNRPPSHMKSLVDNEIYQHDGQSEGERSPSLGPRLEPEGGN